MYVSSKRQLSPTAPMPRLRFRLRKGFLGHRNQLDDPAVNRGMIDEHALLHHLFEIAQTQRVRDVPPDAQQNDGPCVREKRMFSDTQALLTLATRFVAI